MKTGLKNFKNLYIGSSRQKSLVVEVGKETKDEYKDKSEILEY